MIVAILSTGPSMSPALADRVRHLPRIAINTNFQIAPDAAALAGSDSTFWREYPEALKFAGRKFAAWNVRGVETVRTGGINPSSCSAVLALEVARSQMGASGAMLLGMDFHGGHWFGQYRGACERKKPTNWEMHRNQLSAWKRANRGFKVVNCTHGTKLDLFPVMSLEDALAERCAA
jgi:hypothetical protein